MAVRGPQLPPLDARALAARYPFLPGSEGLLAGIAPSVRELLESLTFEPVRLLARARVRQAVDDPTGATPVKGLEAAQGEERVLSFLYARLLVSLPTSPVIARRWCVSEAKSAWRLLERAGIQELLDVAEGLGVPARLDRGAKGEDRLVFPLPSYLKMALPLREAEYRLARQRLVKGEVTVRRKEGARLLQEAIRSTLTRTVPVPLDDGLRGALEGKEGAFVAELVARLPAAPVGSGGAVGFHPGAFPPCIRQMRETLLKGENLSHAGRFALAAFLHRVGANPEFIVDSYRGAPDFDEGVTRYQVEHITRHDEGKGYAPPACARLITDGLCCRDRDDSPKHFCSNPQLLGSPLNFYGKRAQELTAGGTSPPPGAPATSGGPASSP
jgi:DNA primase large subunit